MRVCYLLAGLGHTGGSMVLYNFMDKLSERGYTVHAVTPEGALRWGPGFSREVIRRFKSGAPRGITPWVKRGVKNILKRSGLRVDAPLRLYRLIQHTQVLVRNWVESDITIATFWTTAYPTFFLSERTLPLYHLQHWEEVFCHDEFSRQMVRLTYRLPLGLISNSSWLRETVRKRVGRESYLLLPGVDSKTFSPRGDIRSKYSNPKTVRIVTYFSPVDFKGWPDGVAAMRKVFAEAGAGRVEWLVYGGRPRTDPGVPVSFVGRLFGQELADLYSSAHIVFMPSWYESFPLPPIEAMACGAAVVVTGTGTEDYAVDEENALVRPARDPVRLAEAILELIQSPSKAYRLAKAGLETARKMTWEAATDRLEEILQTSVRLPTVQEECR
jgi:glycosyltransferase involved in cell wall biosynthesis